ncbi:MAG: alpha/beta fold hydrolase [Gemmatimonadaceae bacterium]
MAAVAARRARPQKSTVVRLSSAHVALVRGYFTALARLSPRAAERQAAFLFCLPRRLRHDDVPAIPQEAHAHAVPLGTRRLAAWTWGDGPRVLLAHGWEGTARDMVPIANALAARGRSVTVFDMPAHGLSDGRTTTLPEMARAIGAVAGVTGPPDAVVGHSLGAAAVILALRDGLAATDAALLAPVAEPWLFVRRLAELLAFSEERYAGLVERISERAGISLDAVDGAAAARTLSARAVIIHDPADRQVPFAHAESLASAWHGATLHAVERLGHRRPLLAPDSIEIVASHLAPAGAARG